MQIARPTVWSACATGLWLRRHPLCEQAIRQPIGGFGRDGFIMAIRCRVKMPFGVVCRLALKI
jgi:hypothetical protein